MRPLALLSLLLCPFAILSAQRRPMEVAIYGRMTDPDGSLSRDRVGGFGGRIGLYMRERVALEADWSRGVSPAPALELAPTAVRVTYHVPIAAGWTGILGAGWVDTRIDPAGPAAATREGGPTAIIGVRQEFGAGVGVRVDAVYDYLPHPARDGVDQQHAGLQVGLSWRLGRLAVRRG